MPLFLLCSAMAESGAMGLFPCPRDSWNCLNFNAALVK